MTVAPDWDVSSVAQEFEVQLGKRLDAAVSRGELRWVINNRGVRWGRVLTSEAVQAPLTTADIRDLRLGAGDVLMCEGGEIGRAAVWHGELTEAYFLNTLHRLRSKGRYNPNLLVSFFERWATTGELSALVGKATLAHLTKENLLRVPLPVPPSGEQKRVVEALADVDSSAALLERLIRKKRAIKRAILQELMNGHGRLPGFSDTWAESTVGAIADVKTGPFGSALHEKDYVPAGTPIITVEHLGEFGVVADGAPMVSDRDRRRLDAYSLHEGDVVFSRVGSIDRNARVGRGEEGWLFSGRLLRVRFKPGLADSRFMSAQFHQTRFTDAVRSVAVGQTMPSLNTSILRAIRVDLPPLDEQRAIGMLAERLDAELQFLYRRLDKARAIKQGMMQELLTGRTRFGREGAA